MATSAPAREELLAEVRIVRELGARTPGTYLGHRDEHEPVAGSAEGGTARAPKDVVLETYANLDPTTMKRVTESARKLRDSARHPHIVRVLSAERIGNGLSVVTDFIDGVPLDDVFFGMSLGARLRAVVDVLSALSALHSMGIVHGGVVRASSFVERTGRTMLGFAYRQPLCLRKETYAPEMLLADQSAIGPVSDVYGAGVFLWEAVTGRVLFGSEAPEKIIARQLGKRIDPALPPKGDRWARTLAPVVEKALALDPNARYGSIAEMAAALRIAVRARLMMHEDVIEEIWPAETKPKVTSGIQPAAAPVAWSGADAPMVAVEAAPQSAPPPAPEPLSMDKEKPVEGAESGIVPVEPKPPPRVAMTNEVKRRSSAMPIVVANVILALVVAGVAVFTLAHGHGSPVAPHADALETHPPPQTSPGVAPVAPPPSASVSAQKSAPEKPSSPAAHPQHKTPKHAPTHPAYDPETI